MEGGGTPRSRQTVLVVDDEPAYVEAYERWLAEDYDVRTATGGDEALSAFDRDVDVVLLDRRMPDRSGREVLAELRERDPDCRVAMVTAVAPREEIFEMAFDDYVLKPVGREQLRRTVETLVRLGDVTEDLRTCYALAVKKAALEASLEEDALEDSSEYDTLARRLSEREENVDSAIEDFLARGTPDRVYQSL